MSGLLGEVVDAAALTRTDRAALFALMTQVYDGVDRTTFERDLTAKDECILLRTPAGETVGFSTQRFLTVEAAGRRVDGVFSGDTVIRPDHWGSPALFQAFARRYIVHRDPPREWFLISKGHRTYRMLTTFFAEFWPSRHAPTPDAARAVMDAYALALYPDDYNPSSGVIEYRVPHDRLRPGVAGTTERDLRNPDVAFFATRNPGHARGHDLVCLCELTPANLKPRMRPLLLGAEGGPDGALVHAGGEHRPHAGVLA